MRHVILYKRASFALFAAVALLLSGCGGGGGGGGGGTTIVNGAGNGSLLGKVSEFNGNSALAQVAVSLLQDGSNTPLLETFTDARGNFRFENLARGPVYRLEVKANGFNNEQYESIDLTELQSLQLETVRLVSDDNSGTGGLAGKATNAADGQPVDNATLQFRPGINARTGAVAASTTTDAFGDYTVGALPYGNVTVEVVKPGLETTYSTLQVLGNIIREDQNVAISPRVSVGETRVVLTWGASPSDLDAHLTGPSETAGGTPFHVFFNRRSSDGAMLDVDDRSAFGPETITFDAARTGVYRYTVHRYSSDTPEALSQSGARVQVIRPEGVIADFFVPPGEGVIWRVFDMVNGELRPLNTLNPLTNTNEDWFAPENLRAR